MLSIDIAGGVVIEDQHEAGDASERAGAEMGQVGNAGHLNLDWHGDLALNLFGTATWPLGDDLDVVVGNVGIGFNGQSAKSYDAPPSQQENAAQHQPTAFEGKIDKSANHLLVSLGLK
jgi:hypothetical protein